MNTQQLKCFVCVADKLNFTKAAEELFLSVPTVTHHIKNLEEELGTLLFIRTSKIVKLTDAGNHFYADAKDILDKFDMAEKKIKKIISRNTKFFKIGCTSNAEIFYLEKILSSLRKSFPNIYTQLTQRDYFSLKNLFVNKQLDVMLATREMIRDIPECRFIKTKEMKTYAIVPDDSHLKGKNKISFEDLKNECIIALHPKFIPFHYMSKDQDPIMIRSQTNFDIICENDQTAVLLAKCGYGITVLPEFCIPEKALNMNLIPVYLSNEHENGHDIEYGIAFHRNDRSKYLNEFIKYFKEQFG